MIRSSETATVVMIPRGKVPGGIWKGGGKLQGKVLGKALGRWRDRGDNLAGGARGPGIYPIRRILGQSSCRRADSVIV